jgi:hypothetical protein
VSKKAPEKDIVAYYRANPIQFLEEHYITESGKKIVFEEWQKTYILRPILFTKPVCLTCKHLVEKNPEDFKLEAPIKVCTKGFERGACPNNETWQKQYRQYTEAVISLTKKDGKSTMGGCFGLLGLYIDVPSDEAPPEIYGSAGDKDQAKIIWKRCEDAIARNKYLADGCKLLINRIEVKGTRAEYKPLSSESPTKHGLNPSMVIFDEVWNQGDEELIEALADSPVRKQPLRLFFTYAGHDMNTPLGRIFTRGKKGDDDTLFFFWSHSNLASWKSEKFVEGQRKKLTPARFIQYYKNDWVTTEDNCFTYEDVMGCVGWPQIAQFENRGTLKLRLRGEQEFEYVMAIDLAFKHDRCAVAIGHREDDFIILDSLKTFTPHPNIPVKIDWVIDYVELALKQFNIHQVVCDPWQAGQLIHRLRQQGQEVKEFNFKRQQNLVAMRETLWSLIHYGLFRMPRITKLINELLTVKNVQKSYGLRIDHKAGNFDDMVIAVGMLALELVGEPPTAGKPAVAAIEYTDEELDDL